MSELYTFLVTTIAKFITTGLANALAHVFHIVLRFLQQNFFSHGFISATLNFFEAVGALMLLAGAVKTLIVAAEQHLHGESGGLGARMLNFIKAYAMLFLVMPVVLLSHSFVIRLSMRIAAPFVPDFSDVEITMKDASLLDGAASSILFAIIFTIMLISSILILFHTLKQYVTLYVQVLTGYLYVYDVASGNSNAIGEWGRDVITGRITFGLQLICYQVGMYLCAGAFSNEDYTSLLVGSALLIGVCTIPSALKKWGNAVGGGGGGAIATFASVAASVMSKGKAAAAS